VAGALAGALALRAWEHRKTDTTGSIVPPPPPAPLQLTSGDASTRIDVTVAPRQNITQQVQVGAVVIAWLPLGGRWVSIDGAGAAGNTVAPQPFEFQGPITHTYVWLDTTTRTTQTSVINYIVAPPPANTNA